jgi:hypothetical protein
MADIRVQIPDEVLGALKSKLNLKNGTDVVMEALTMLNWAAEEKQKNRIILSTDGDGKDVTRLAMKSLMNVNKQS